MSAAPSSADQPSAPPTVQPDTQANTQPDTQPPTRPTDGAEHGTVLLVPPLSPALAAAVEASYRTVRWPEQGRDELLAEHAAEITAIVCTNGGRIPAELIESLPRLGIVANHGVGYDNVDLATALPRGVQVTHTPDVLDDAVAETALALLLAVRRQVVAADRFVRAGRWPDGPFPLTDQIAGSTVGILGMGRIGRAVATRLEAFGAAVRYHNRREIPGTRYPYAASVTELAAAVDSLIVVVPGGPSTAGLVDAEVLEALGPEGVLINIARGRWSTRTPWSPRSRAAGSEGPDSTSTATSRTCRRPSPAATTWYCSPTSRRAPASPGPRWNDSPWTTWTPGCRDGRCSPRSRSCGTDVRPHPMCSVSTSRRCPR